MSGVAQDHENLAPQQPPRAAAFAWPARLELEALVRGRLDPTSPWNWELHRRLKYGYFAPSDVYEAVVARYVVSGCRWLDVGGGRTILPFNGRLARELVARCAHVVAVDPSDHVLQNDFVHERIRARLEDFAAAEPFDLATMRMVAEHVSDPAAFVAALARLVRPGGWAVVLTVNRWTPLALAAKALPLGLRRPIKRLLWRVEPADSFPVHYRMNTRRALAQWFDRAGFDEHAFAKIDDLALFCHWRALNYFELQAWRALRRLGWTYPENCLFGVYQRRPRGRERAESV